MLSSILILYLFINTGLLGVYVFHETPHQMTLKKNDLQNNGDKYTLQKLYVNYYPPEDYEASTWIGKYQQIGSVIYGTGKPIKLLSYFTYTGYSTHHPPGKYRLLNNSSNFGGGIQSYVYLNTYSTQTQTVSEDYERKRGSRDDFVELSKVGDFSNSSLIYNNGRAKIFLSDGSNNPS